MFAQGIPGGLRMLTEGRLVIVPGDRHDVVMAACLAELSGTRLAALLLSVGTEPDPRVWDLTRATRATGLPILVVDDSSYETATRVRDLDPGLPIDDLERIEAVTDTIADALDASWLESLPSLRPVPPAEPRRFPLSAGRAIQRCRTRAWSCPRAPSPGSCRPPSRAPTEASPAACCWGRRTRWQTSPGVSGCTCPTASPWSIPRLSPSATSPR